MKRTIFIIILVLGIYGTSFSYEAWLQAGFGYGNYFGKTQGDGHTIRAYLGSPGFDIGSFQFWDKFGFFIDFSFSFPTTVNVNVDGYNYTFQFGYVIGPAFKFNLTEHMKLEIGLGFSSILAMGDHNKASLFSYNLGIGSDTGFVYTVNDLVIVTIGTLAHYHFANREKIIISDKDENHEWKKKYSMIGIRPYISIGFVFKPKD